MDNDGFPDLISAGIIPCSDGHYNFAPVQFGFGDPLVIGDFNGDGYLDIVCNIQTWLGGPNRTFTAVNNAIDLADVETCGKPGGLRVVGGDSEREQDRRGQERAGAFAPAW